MEVPQDLVVFLPAIWYSGSSIPLLSTFVELN